MDRFPRLTEEQILAWADAWLARTGDWPHQQSGSIPEASRQENWRNIDMALRDGGRGLEGDTSLARLLEERRGVRNKANLPPLTIKQILQWADAWFARCGAWPSRERGPVAETFPEETWSGIDTALKCGIRGLPGGTSLARVLAERRKRKKKP
jgi:hypothetical protein